MFYKKLVIPPRSKDLVFLRKSYEKILNKRFRFMYDSWYGIDNPPRQDESIFFSLAARNKYLNDKSLDINLKRTFMFNR